MPTSGKKSPFLGLPKKKKSPWDLSPAKPKPGDKFGTFDHTRRFKQKPTSLMNIDDRIIELDAQLDEAFEFMFPDTRGMRQKELERLAASNRAISPPKLSRKEKLMAALESAKGKAKRAGRTTRVMGKRRGRQAMRHIGRHPGKYAAGLGGLGAAALLLAGRSRKD